jgi:hypothetical protein
VLYEIREEDGKFDLYFRKKKGLKFKKSFNDLQEAEWYLERYLAHCCISCLQRGWVYKVRKSGGLRKGGSRGSRPWIVPRVDSTVACPECRAEHRVQYSGWKLFLVPKLD